jgi:hypothetical protein
LNPEYDIELLMQEIQDLKQLLQDWDEESEPPQSSRRMDKRRQLSTVYRLERAWGMPLDPSVMPLYSYEVDLSYIKTSFYDQQADGWPAVREFRTDVLGGTLLSRRQLDTFFPLQHFGSSRPSSLRCRGFLLLITYHISSMGDIDVRKQENTLARSRYTLIGLGMTW